MKEIRYFCCICKTPIRREEHRASARLFWDSTYPLPLGGVNCLYKWDDVCRKCTKKVLAGVRRSVDAIVHEARAKALRKVR